MTAPDLYYESFGTFPVCGIDEAGRGPCAGPLCVAAVILDHDAIPKGIKDSKAMSARQRNSVAKDIKDTALAWSVVIVSPRVIDQKNVLRATLDAMSDSVEALKIKPKHALIDGNQAPKLMIPLTTIVKGDQKSLSIGAASIIAKTTRDAIMIDMDKDYPNYGFANHKGYQTRTHLDALRQYGACEHHRRTWSTIYNLTRLNIS